MPSEFPQHSYIPSSVIMSPLIHGLFENVKDKATVLAGWILTGAWVTERADHFTPVRSHSHPAWAHWKTPIRGPAFALRPVWPLQPLYQQILCGCVYIYTPLHSLSSAFLLPYPSTTPEVSFVSDLTCILRRTLLTYLPTTEIQNHKGITNVNAFHCSPSWLSVRGSHRKKKRPPSGKNREIWFVHPSSRSLSGRLPECKSASRVLLNERLLKSPPGWWWQVKVRR